MKRIALATIITLTACRPGDPTYPTDPANIDRVLTCVTESSTIESAAVCLASPLTAGLVRAIRYLIALRKARQAQDGDTSFARVEDPELDAAAVWVAAEVEAAR